MKEIIIIKIVSGCLLTIGALVILLIAYKIYYKYLIQEKRCTNKTKGNVKRYTLASRGRGVFLPVVTYVVEGKQYKVVGPEYKGYILKNVSTPMVTENEVDFAEDDKQRLIVNYKTNSMFSVFKNPMSTLYPKGTEVDVYYDPKKPKLAYVLRYCNRKIYFWFLFIIGLAVLAIDIVIQILL